MEGTAGPGKSESPISMFKKRKSRDTEGNTNQIEILGISEDSDIANRHFLYVYKVNSDPRTMLTKSGEEIAREYPYDLLKYFLASAKIN